MASETVQWSGPSGIKAAVKRAGHAHHVTASDFITRHAVAGLRQALAPYDKDPEALAAGLTTDGTAFDIDEARMLVSLRRQSIEQVLAILEGNKA